MAIMMARSGKRTLLLDADLRRPMVHKVFKLNRDSGLTTILSGETPFEKTIQEPVIGGKILKHLDVITSGPTCPNPSSLIESGDMYELLQSVREHYDAVIIDAPPALFVTDASILASASDGVVLVAKANNNTKGMLLQVKRQMERANANIIGALLNQVKVSRLGKYYSEYYNQGYYRYRRNYYSTYYGNSKKENKSTKAG